MGAKLSFQLRLESLRPRVILFAAIYLLYLLKSFCFDHRKHSPELVDKRYSFSPLVTKYYSKEGKKVGEAGEVDLDTSYIHLLNHCKDFKNEQSQLEKIGAKYGYEIWFTPKYHCELAGEGIEYMWRCVKWIYHRIKKEKKSAKQMFEDCVKQIVNGNMVSAERIRRFSRRAR